MTIMNGVERIPVSELHARLKAQGVSNPNHCAFVRPICGTVQSMASLVKAGASPNAALRMIGFSCEGRLTNAGEWPSDANKTTKARKRRQVRGCDWTLGGMFRVHKLAVVTDGGDEHPLFVIATPEQAIALERASLAAPAAVGAGEVVEP